MPIQHNAAVLDAFRAYCKQMCWLYPCEAVSSVAMDVFIRFCNAPARHLDVQTIQVFFECVACFASHRTRVAIADQERDTVVALGDDLLAEGDYIHPCFSPFCGTETGRAAERAWCDISITVVKLLGRAGGDTFLGKHALAAVSGMLCFPVVEVAAVRSFVGFWAYVVNSGPDSALAFGELVCNVIQYTDDVHQRLTDMDTAWGEHLCGIPVVCGCTLVATLHLLWNHLVFTPGGAAIPWCPFSPICESDLVLNTGAYSPSKHTLNVLGLFMMQVSRVLDVVPSFKTGDISVFKRVVVSLLREYGHKSLLVAGCAALLASLGLGTECESSVFTPTESRELGSVFACVSRFQRETTLGMRYVALFYSMSVAFKEGFDDRRLKTIRRDRHVVMAVVANGYRASTTSVAGAVSVRPRVWSAGIMAIGLPVFFFQRRPVAVLNIPNRLIGWHTCGRQ